VDASCVSKLPFICKKVKLSPNATVAQAPAFLSKLTGSRFVLSTIKASQYEAEQACLAQGGHLASFKNLEEQAAVESFYTTAGFLLPAYHRYYWMGLDSTTSTWPKFRWMDRSLPGPTDATYMHWGRDGVVSEPNNATGSELCGVANVSQAYSGAWGWSDARCSMSAPFMCRAVGGSPAAQV
jgi:hypothetical protein